MPRNLGFLETFPVLAALPTSVGAGRIVTLSTDGHPYFDHSTGWQRMDVQIPASSGDMLKSVYDTNNDGKIDPAAHGTGTPTPSTFLRGDGAWASSATGAMYANALQEIAEGRRGGFPRSARALAFSSMRVLFLGDSITEDGDLLTLDDSYPAQITRWFQRSSNATFTFANYSLGGRRIDNLDNPSFLGAATEPADLQSGFGPRAAGDRPWVVVGKSWMQHVQDFAPDLIILALGMNNLGELDAAALQAPAFRSAISKMQAFAVRPDVLMVTTMLPTALNVATSGRRLDVARSVIRMQRAVGAEKNVAIADAGRLSRLLRDGLDDTQRASRYEANWGGPGFVGWTGATASWTQNATDGSTLARISNANAGYISRPNTFIDGEFKLDVQFSVEASITQILQIRYRNLDMGYLLIQMFGGLLKLLEVSPGGVVTQLGTDYVFTQTTAFRTLRVVCNQNEHFLYVDGVLAVSASTVRNLQEGGISMGFDQGVAGYALPINLRNFQHIIREPLAGSPMFSEAEILGTYPRPLGTSGNGLNHPSALGIAMIYTPAIRAALSNMLEAPLNASPTRIVTANYTVLPGDSVIFANASAGPFNVTLPAASGYVGGVGQQIRIKKADGSANAVTILTAGGLIDGAASAVIRTPYNSFDFVPDGTNWGGF